MSYGIGKVTVTVMTLIPNETIKQGFQVDLQNLFLFTTLPFTNITMLCITAMCAVQLVECCSISTAIILFTPR